MSNLSFICYDKKLKLTKKFLHVTGKMKIMEKFLYIWFAIATGIRIFWLLLEVSKTIAISPQSLVTKIKGEMLNKI